MQVSRRTQTFLRSLVALLLLFFLISLYSSRSMDGILSSNGRGEARCAASDQKTEVKVTVLPESVDDDPTESECVCQKEGNDTKQFNFCFSVKINGTIKRGQKFDCKWVSLLDKLQILEPKSVLKTKFVNPVFVTASSSNHFTEARGLITSIGKLFGNTTRIIFYDIGLQDSEVVEIKAACNVEYRKFPFEEHPQSVRSLLTYRWKILIISALQTEFSTFWWVDSSVRWLNNSMDDVYEAVSGGRIASYLTADPAHHGMLAATNPAMYKYLPINEEKAKSTMMYGASYALFHRSPASVEVLKWLVLCALEDNCINPPNSQIMCNFADRKNWALYAGCHRYDQSALNIILANLNDYDVNFYTAKNFQAFAEAKRDDRDHAKLTECVSKMNYASIPMFITNFLHFAGWKSECRLD